MSDRRGAAGGEDGRVGVVGRDAVEVIRSEEQLQVSTRRVPVRRARLERIQITEMITMEVPVIREDVRIVYDTLDQDTADSLSTEQRAAPVPWVLRGERIVITKEWVPLETVALEIETVTEQQQVTDDVRKEQVALQDTPAQADDAAPPTAPAAGT